MRPWHVGTLTHCIAALAQAAAPIPASDKLLCATTCRKTFQTLRFSDVPLGQAFSFNECTSRLHHQALYLCWRVHCTAQARLAESRSLNETCQDLVGSRLPPYSIVDGFTEQDVARLTRFNATFPTREQPVSSLMLPSSEFYHLWARTLDALDYVHYYHYYYGWAMGLFWALVVAVGITNRAVDLLKSWRPQSLSSERRIWTWLKRWNFSTYNNFHRWVARVATAQAVIHSVGYTVLILKKGGWEYFCRLWTLTFWWTGELATVFMCLLVGCSAFWIRRRRFEAFLIIHIALSVLILATMLGHVQIFKGRYNALVWVPSLVWLLDRILRAARVLSFNPVIWNTTALVSYNERAHMVRVVVPVSSSLYRIQPGTFYYIMVLNRWNFWESHPFTVASAAADETPKVAPQETSPLLERSPSLAERSEGQMTFLIRPYDGFTLRLKEDAESSWPKPAAIRVAIDGPYGETLPLHHFDRVLFVVGGSGIAVALSYLRTLAFADRPAMVYIHWAVQQAALAVDIVGCEMRCVWDSQRVQVNIYVTRPAHGAVSDKFDQCNVSCKPGRMDIEKLVQAALGAGGKSNLAVVASGPASMADECRRVVVSRMLSSLPRIEYFEENFQ
ncbi:ferric-chelate reductase, partial [Metarhizium majus ARSEF 297]